jgi:hypothetical protein
VTNVRHVAAAAGAVLLMPSMAGCWSGYDAGTSVQANQAVGNGVNLTAGEVEVRGATWVRNVDSPGEATLVATFVNNAEEPDRLVKVEIDPPSPMGITGGELEIPTSGSVRTGHWSTSFINAFDVKAFPSTFAPTTFTFRDAGTVTGEVLVVSNTGQYAGVVVSFDTQQELLEVAAGTDESEDEADGPKAKKNRKKAGQEKAEQD